MYHKTLCQKQSSITSWLELLEYDGRRKHRAIVYFTSTDVYKGITRKIYQNGTSRNENVDCTY